VAPVSVPGFETLDVLSESSTGLVLRARSEADDRVVALRVSTRYDQLEPERQQRFSRESQTLCELAHPNLARIFATGSQGNLAWVAEEYLEGVTLRDLLKALRGPLSPEAALGLGLQLSTALMALEAVDVVHLDLSPDTLRITPEGVLKLCDFGFGFEGSLSARLRAGTVPVSRVDYLSPEAIEDDASQLSCKADLYSMGALLYRCLGGRSPFGDLELSSRLYAIVHEAPRPLTDLEGLPPEAIELVERFMERDPDDRPLAVDAVAWVERAATECQVSGGPNWEYEALADAIAGIKHETTKHKVGDTGLLVSLRGTDRTVEWVLGPGEHFEIGRAPDADVTLRARSVSRRHVRVVNSEHGLAAKDLGSSNGTAVNDKRVRAQRARKLNDGDLLRIGERKFEVHVTPLSELRRETSRCQLCSSELSMFDIRRERARCPVDWGGSESRLRHTLEERGFTVERHLPLLGFFQRFVVLDPDENRWRVGAAALGQQAARELREASAVALELSHPGLLAVTSLDVHRGTLLVVSDGRGGLTLAEHVAKHGPLNAADVVRLGVRLADAIDFVYDAGIPHALVRPELVLLGETPEDACLMDVGLSAELVDAERTRRCLATKQACYEAPELQSVVHSTPQSLVYALGATLCFALTGSPVAEIRRGKRFDYLPLTMIEWIPPRLAEALAGATTPDVESRLPDVQALAAPLRALLGEDEEELNTASGDDLEPFEHTMSFDTEDLDPNLFQSDSSEG